MGLAGWSILLAFGGPALGVGAILADSVSGGRPISSRRLIIGGTAGGAITWGVGGCVVAIVPEGAPLAGPLGVLAGGVVGAIIGGAAALTRRAANRHRDRTV